MTIRLDGQVAVVTAAWSGIASATAAALAEAGATVVAVARRQERRATLVDSNEQSGGRAEARVANVAEREQALAANGQTVA